MNFQKPIAIFIIGVSGVGKSTIGHLLSKSLDIPFFDGDDFHPEKNIVKMAGGQALNDDDRFEWLVNLNELGKEQLLHNSCIIACSALKESYRTLLKKDLESQVKWVLLDGTFDQISKRLKDRKGHFMPTSLLKSQFEILERPQEALTISVQNSPNKINKIIVDHLTKKSEFGVLGLGVMGKSLCRNLATKGFRLSLYNRHVKGSEEDVASHFKKEFSELSEAQAFDDLGAFINSLQQPRKILLMVNAGKPVDLVIENLRPLLDKNDVLIDGGNSHYKNTQARIDLLNKEKIHFIGAGVSGGEEGALKGPSIMPGGNASAYQLVRPFLEAIAAKDGNNLPCCAYIGNGGSGHFTKMVHNGIEYAEMQLLSEVYFILKNTGKNSDQIASILESWKPSSNSYLLEITIDILRTKEGNAWLIDLILDVSGNKGTGNWTTVAMAELGVPSTMIPTALFARFISSFKEERIMMQGIYPPKRQSFKIDLDTLHQAYDLARLINHHQGFTLLDRASEAYDWSLNLSETARIWTNGCIIRSDLMVALATNLKESSHLLLQEAFIPEIKKYRPSLNSVVAQCVLEEIPIPCFSEAANFLNGISKETSAANLIQAQRDYFGAHTYFRIDDPTNSSHHTNWINTLHD